MYYINIARDKKRKAAVNMKYTKSEIMRAAWRMARYGQKKFGGKTTDYIADAMKKAWETAKKMVQVPTWFINKKIVSVGLCTNFEKAIVEKETEKAVLVNICKVGENIWVPKSVLI